jgi:hypothetical protein
MEGGGLEKRKKPREKRGQKKTIEEEGRGGGLKRSNEAYILKNHQRA